MLLLAIDENFNNDIVRGIRRRNSTIDLLRIQDAGLMGADDPTVLEWAACECRVLLTHDVATMTKHAFDRTRQSKSMPGLIEVSRYVPIGIAINDLVLLAEFSLDGEWEGQVIYLPLR